MICLNQLPFKLSNDVLGGYDLSIDKMSYLFADTKVDIVRTGTDILRTHMDKMFF